jgi:3-dehydroquinate synthase
MKTIRVNLKERSHNIIIGNRLLNSAGKIIRKLNIGNDAFIITNSLIKNRFGRQLSRALKQAGIDIKFRPVPDSEQSKSIEVAYSLVRDLSKFDKKRRVFIIALGGGVVGDIAGFVASIYKRGIPFIQVPTTLLAQIDSSIGGKTAIDLIVGKNLVGAFYQPKLILTDISTLDSLDTRQIRAGLAEAIKYGIIKDGFLFGYLEKYYTDILKLNKRKVEFLVYRCSKIKARIVELDEIEKKGIRTILNFGHTLGHAIEAASGYRGLNHGEAIALGMLAATYISKKIGFIDEAIYERIKNLIESTGLPVKIKKSSIPRIIKAHYRDKKFIGEKNRFVLIKGIGRPIIVRGIKLEIIKEALKKLI